MADLFSSSKPGARGKESKGKSSYSAKDIEVLEGLEPVRRRPGMYIGGTDEAAMHHLAAEILDNAMDEAVAGEASRIEMSLAPGNWLTVRDNGRGIPVDPHPKFKNRSALEVILTTLHSGGKFSAKVYETSGGLHGVGLSVVNALADELEVEVAREKKLWVQTYVRGKPKGKLKNAGAAPNRRGTTIRFHPDPEIFGKDAEFSPARLYRMARAKAHLHRGVEIVWSCDQKLLGPKDATPADAVLHFPGGLVDFVAEALDGRTSLTPTPFAGEGKLANGGGTEGRIEWALTWPVDGEGQLDSYCNTVPTPQGGTHEAGLRSGLIRAIKAYGELAGNRKAGQITADDVMEGVLGALSIFIRDPQFQGQTKERLASSHVTRMVDAAIKDHFDHWLSGDPATADRLLEALIERAEERAARRRDKEQTRKSATRKLRLPGKLSDCSNGTSEGTEIFLVEGDFGRRLREAGARPAHPGGVAAARQDPQRRHRNQREAPWQPGNQRPDPGTRLRHGFAVRCRQAALRARHHHDRCGRGRRAYRLAADHLLLPRDGGADRSGTALPRRAAALPPDPGWADGIRPRRRPQGRVAQERVQGARQDRDQPIQGPGRDAAGPAQGNHHGPDAADLVTGGDPGRRTP